MGNTSCNARRVKTVMTKMDVHWDQKEGDDI